ncbi:hypothetical protein P6F26_09860 [Roseibacterium sp. SDUM158017]|uniref:hypothetical protein n=1 Tax=Roseicyclus salinarum TaxID=3036773 RepID=UPI0024156435|nr:hypothetical protein [Roseibacterium sp. SDUM158017]MDG4648749.1 hypothetical protein [Roseibacterium sp. SDUM158017]
MPQKKHKPEEIVAKLRQVDVLLREERLVTFQKGRVVFDDFDGVKDLAGFDTSYLDQDGTLLR